MKNHLLIATACLILSVIQQSSSNPNPSPGGGWGTGSPPSVVYVPPPISKGWGPPGRRPLVINKLVSPQVPLTVVSTSPSKGWGSGGGGQPLAILSDWWGAWGRGGVPVDGITSSEEDLYYSDSPYVIVKYYCPSLRRLVNAVSQCPPRRRIFISSPGSNKGHTGYVPPRRPTILINEEEDDKGDSGYKPKPQDDGDDGKGQSGYVEKPGGSLQQDDDDDGGNKGHTGYLPPRRPSSNDNSRPLRPSLQEEEAGGGGKGNTGYVSRPGGSRPLRPSFAIDGGSNRNKGNTGYVPKIRSIIEIPE